MLLSERDFSSASSENSEEWNNVDSYTEQQKAFMPNWIEKTRIFKL